MDDAVSIERRLAAMKVFHDAGIRTTCFISPIFPGITDVAAIIRRAKEQCNLIWLENLNLRGGYKTVILDYIKEKYPKLIPLYQDIYQKNDRSYWVALDEEMKKFTRDEELLYVRNDDSICRPFEESPIVVNYFFHEEIVPSAKKRMKNK
jgi:DNA repair photolyase